jgi:hypothetical protein
MIEGLTPSKNRLDWIFALALAGRQFLPRHERADPTSLLVQQAETSAEALVYRRFLRNTSLRLSFGASTSPRLAQMLLRWAAAAPCHSEFPS